jgi:hypothetical protein
MSIYATLEILVETSWLAGGLSGGGSEWGNTVRIPIETGA